MGTPSLASLESGPQRDLSRLTVLLVDDDVDALDCLAHLIRGARAEVITACSADEAIAILQWCVPDVIVSDLEMPGDDGFELIRRVRSRPTEAGGATPAIALSAHAGRHAHERALHGGFQLHLPKPIRVRELIGAIAGLVATA